MNDPSPPHGLYASTTNPTPVLCPYCQRPEGSHECLAQHAPRPGDLSGAVRRHAPNSETVAQGQFLHEIIAAAREASLKGLCTSNTLTVTHSGGTIESVLVVVAMGPGIAKLQQVLQAPNAPGSIWVDVSKAKT